MTNRLEKLRKQKGLTLKELALDLVMSGYFEKITDATLSNYENEKREPKLETWQKLADYFEISVDYLQGAGYEKDLINARISYYTRKLGVLITELFYEPNTQQLLKIREIAHEITLLINDGLSSQQISTLHHEIVDLIEHISTENDFNNYDQNYFRQVISILKEMELEIEKSSNYSTGSLSYSALFSKDSYSTLPKEKADRVNDILLMFDASLSELDVETQKKIRPFLNKLANELTNDI